MKQCVVVVAVAVCGLLHAGDGWSQGSAAEGTQGHAEENARIGRLAYAIGNMYAYGKGVKRDLEKAFEYYLTGAAAGHVKAQSAVGVCYWGGYGTVCNRKEASYWLEQAASQGDGYAMFEMGAMRHFGFDGNTNCYEACQWFRAAAQNGYGNPGYEPDTPEEEGCGPEVSACWIASAAEFGNEDALYWLAVCYLREQGVPRDKQMYEYLMKCAADKGESMANCVMGCDKWYGRISGTRDEGLELVREAEAQGNITAYTHLENLDKTGSL